MAEPKWSESSQAETDGALLSGETERPADVAGGPELRNEDIARRAYEIYLKREGDDGRDQEDWFRAEAELRAEMTVRARPEGAES